MQSMLLDSLRKTHDFVEMNTSKENTSGEKTKTDDSLPNLKQQSSYIFSFKVNVSKFIVYFLNVIVKMKNKNFLFCLVQE